MQRSKVIGVSLVFVLAALFGGLALTNDALGDEPEKKLFPIRWYQEPDGNYDQWMTLSTSAVHYVCGASEADCASRWEAPTEAAVDDWNSQETTVRLQMRSNQSQFNNLNIYVGDIIMLDPGILGLAVPYDENFDLCFENCDIRFGEVYAADLPHYGPYGTGNVRQATMTHEIGHQLGLMHESVDEEGYSVYPCGEDYQGAIPVSVMSYNCIDPEDVGGMGIVEVQPWDVCGVNHAYPDPNIGMAGCEGGETPTPEPTDTPDPTATVAPTTTPEASPPPGPTGTPAGVMIAWANVDCDEGLSTRDNQAILRVVLSQPQLSQTQPCNAIGTTVSVAGVGDVKWADADCDGELTTRDNQALLRKVLSQAALRQTEPCPDVGEEVNVS